MTRVRRWLPISLVALAMTVVGATASAFDVALVPGHIQSSGSFVTSYMPNAAGDAVGVTVQTGLLSFRPHGGGAPILQNGSVVYVSASSASGLFGFGCWLVPAIPITFNRDGSSSLSFDSSLPGVTPCPGFLTSVTPTSAIQAPMNLDPVQGFAGNVRLTAQWSAGINPTNQRSTINTTCGGFTAAENQSLSDGFASATASVTSLTLEAPSPVPGTVVDVPLAGSFDSTNGYAEVSTSTDNMVINGPSTGSCGPFGN
jgi:hypothetical protein